MMLMKHGKADNLWFWESFCGSKFVVPLGIYTVMYA